MRPPVIGGRVSAPPCQVFCPQLHAAAMGWAKHMLMLYLIVKGTMEHVAS